MRYPLGQILWFYVAIILLVLVKEFFGTNVISSREKNVKLVCGFVLPMFD